MSSWARTFNPFRPLGAEYEARIAARAATPALVVSACLSAMSAAVLSQKIAVVKVAMGEEARSLATSSPQTSAVLRGMVENGVVEMGVALVAAWAVVQVVLAAWHWRRPGSFIPIVFLILLTYRLGDRTLDLLAHPGDATWLSILTVVLLLVCVLLHATALRGVARLTAIRNAA